jgi:hypothetical protein
VEARDLNFAAYMNRAIVANEVAIGQLVGLASWAYHFKSFADYVDSYDKLILSPATLGASTPVVSAITGVWRSAGTTAINIMKKVANYGTLVIHNINKIYGFAEFGYHTVSVIFAVGVLDDVMDENGPPGTKISDFGIISLIAHVATYGVLPSLPGEQFATGYGATKTKAEDLGGQDDGYARLAALIRDSRDPFTMARGWELRPPGFPLEIELHPSFGIDLVVASVEFGFDFYLLFDLSLERKGNSELRFVKLPKSGKVKPAEYANWSSADTTGLFVKIIFDFEAWAEACALGLCETVSVGGGFKFGDGKASLYLRILGEDIEVIPEIPFPTAAPFASGFAEVGKNSPNNLGTIQMTPKVGSVGVIDGDKHYGEAPQNLLAWVSPGPGVPTPIGIMPSAEIYELLLGSRVNKKYAGLPFYVDTTGKGPFLGVGAPNLLIGLVQDEGDYDSTTTVEPTGRLGLNEAFAGDDGGRLAVLAKSELYFSRPTDKFASHFHRDDGQVEIGNAFNPYWQARLVDTSYADRTLALAIQQQQDFINLSNSFDALLNKLSGIMPF